MLYLLYACGVWHQSVQYPFVFAGDSCSSLSALGLSAAEEGILLAVYVCLCADAVSDTGSEQCRSDSQHVPPADHASAGIRIAYGVPEYIVSAGISEAGA